MYLYTRRILGIPNSYWYGKLYLASQTEDSQTGFVVLYLISLLRVYMHGLLYRATDNSKRQQMICRRTNFGRKYILCGLRYTFKLNKYFSDSVNKRCNIYCQTVIHILSAYIIPYTDLSYGLFVLFPLSLSLCLVYHHFLLSHSICFQLCYLLSITSTVYHSFWSNF